MPCAKKQYGSSYARFCERGGMKRPAPGVRFSDDYRTIPEGRIIEMLLLAGWATSRTIPCARGHATGARQLDRHGIGCAAGRDR